MTTSDTAGFDARQFRAALGMFATGVTIVTTRSPEGEAVGLTANSFNSVSLEPPMVLWSLAKSSRSLASFQAATWWNVHVLAENQEALSNRFAGGGGDKFAGLALEDGSERAPLIAGCSARFECRTAFQYDGGDHLIFVGEVVGHSSSDEPPLLYVGGKYATALSRSRAPVPDIPFTESLLAYLVGRAHFRFFEGMRPTLAEQGLSATDFFVLSVLAVQQPLLAPQIASRMAYTGVDVGKVTLASLCARQLVVPVATDEGRAYQLGARGNDAFLHVLAAVKSLEADVAGQLSADERESLLGLLKKLLASPVEGRLVDA